jgi:hypothetical protein
MHGFVAEESDESVDDSFEERLGVCWSLLASDVERLRSRGDATAPLRALLLVAAVADGTLASLVEARAALCRGHFG